MPVLHVVTDEAVLARPDFVVAAGRVLAAGGPRVALHVRGPALGGRALFEAASAVAEAASSSGGLLVVNDRVDVAAAAGARGVHLGGRSLPIEVARRLFGGRFRLGVSTHADEEVAEAAHGGADWIFAGMIYASPSHPDRTGRGVQAVAGAVAGSGGIPVLAIGGVTPERVPELRAVGAHGSAAIRGVWEARDPAEAVARYLEAWEGPGEAR